MRILSVGLLVLQIYAALVYAQKPNEEITRQTIRPQFFDGSASITIEDFGKALKLKSLLPSISAPKWTIVNVWATWCEPCLNEIAELDDFNLTDQTVAFNLVGITYESIAQSDLDIFFQTNFQSKPSYATYIGKDPSLQLQQQLQYGMPQTYIFDPNGKLLQHHLGEITSAMLRFKVKELLED